MDTKLVEARSPVQALQLVQPFETAFREAAQEFGGVVVGWLDAIDASQEDKWINPVDLYEPNMAVLEDAAESSKRITDLILTNRIGATDSAGNRLRVALADLLRRLAEARDGLTRYEAEEHIGIGSMEGFLFDTDWIQLANRLIDEHDFTDANEGTDRT